jgi:hypothetical protein
MINAVGKEQAKAKSLMTIRFRATVLVVLALVALALCATYLVPAEQAHADMLTMAKPKKNTVVSISAKEQKAYDRAVAACMDYANQPNPIVVDLSDLELTKAQAENVWTMIYANGELFWINCYGDTHTKTEFRLPCYYDDATIDKMRAKLDKVVEKGLKRIGPGMDDATKVHMLHDFVIDRVNYEDRMKTAYTGLVGRKADCFGFTLTMDLMLRRAGFEVDVAFNDSLDHAWNLVKVDGEWYHIDSSWDNGYTGIDFEGNFDWGSKRCHLYLLESDKSMNKKATDPATGKYIVSHAGWTCHHACTSTKYDFSEDLNVGFYKHCRDYKKIVRSFKAGGLAYKVTGVNKVSVSGVAKDARSMKKLTVPASVEYKGVKYKVTGIKAKAFASSKVKMLRVHTAKLKKSTVKDSLVGSKVKMVKLLDSAKKKKAAYKSIFAKSNSGKSVSVK